MRRILETEANRGFYHIPKEVANAKTERNDIITFDQKVENGSLKGDINSNNGNDVEKENNETRSRFIINSDYVSSLDDTDGSKQYDD